MKYLLMIVAGFSFSLSSQAEIYRYVDEAGQAHYSDRPQPQSERYRPDTHLQPFGKPQLPKLYAKPPKTPAKNTAKKAAQQLAKRQKLCAKLDNRINRLTDKLRGGHTNKQGNTWRQQRRDLADQHYRDCR